MLRGVKLVTDSKSCLSISFWSYLVSTDYCTKIISHFDGSLQCFDFCSLGCLTSVCTGLDKCLRWAALISFFISNWRLDLQLVCGIFFADVWPRLIPQTGELLSKFTKRLSFYQLWKLLVSFDTWLSHLRERAIVVVIWADQLGALLKHRLTLFYALVARLDRGLSIRKRLVCLMWLQVLRCLLICVDQALIIATDLIAVWEAWWHRNVQFFYEFPEMFRELWRIHALIMLQVGLAAEFFDRQSPPTLVHSRLLAQF